MHVLSHLLRWYIDPSRHCFCFCFFGVFFFCFIPVDGHLIRVFLSPTTTNTVQTEVGWSDFLIKPKSLYRCHIATKSIQVWHGIYLADLRCQNAKQVWLVCAAQILQRKTLALPWIIKGYSWWRWFSLPSRWIPQFARKFCGDDSPSLRTDTADAYEESVTTGGTQNQTERRVL